MKTLIIFQTHDELKTSLIDLTDQEYDFLSNANGLCIGIDDMGDDSNNAIVSIDAGFCDNKDLHGGEASEWDGRLCGHEPDDDISTAEKIIITGWV